MDHLRGLKPPIGFGVPWHLFLVLGVALVLAAILLWKRFRPIARSGPLEAAHADLRSRLDALSRQGWIEASEIARFHDALQAIVREHLRETYQLRGERLTTTELLDALASSQVPEERIEIVRTLFTACDLVKFARARPPAEAMRASLRAAYLLDPQGVPV